MTDTDNQNIDAFERPVPRSVWRAMRRGLSCKCPRCNQGKIYGF